MVWVGRDLKDQIIPTPRHGQQHLPLDQVAQNSVQPGLEQFQGGATHNFSGQLVPVPHHPHSKEFISPLSLGEGTSWIVYALVCCLSNRYRGG